MCSGFGCIFVGGLVIIVGIAIGLVVEEIRRHRRG